ncbi:hypothetical protein ACLBR5_26915 [Escherichia coli]
MYGRDAVSQIITFGTMAAKAVIRDAGRAGASVRLCRSYRTYSCLIGMTLAKAFEAEPQLPEIYEADEEVSADPHGAQTGRGHPCLAACRRWSSRRPKLPILRRFTAMKRANIRSPSLIKATLNTPDW